MRLAVKQELERLGNFLTSEDDGKSVLNRGNARQLIGLLSDYFDGLDHDGGLLDLLSALKANGERRRKARKAKR